MRSHVWMTIGLAAGLVLGLAAATTQHPTLITVATGLRPLGTLFLNLLSMVVIPLVVTALFAGVAGLGSVRRVGRLGVRTVGFFWATTLAAVLIGFVVAALFRLVAREDDGGVRAGGDRRARGVHRGGVTPGGHSRCTGQGDALPQGKLAVDGDGLFDHVVARDLAHDARRRRAGPQDLADGGELRAPAGGEHQPVGERAVPGGRDSVRRPPVRRGPRRARDVSGGRRSVSRFAHGRQRSVGEYRE